MLSTRIRVWFLRGGPPPCCVLLLHTALYDQCGLLGRDDPSTPVRCKWTFHASLHLKLTTSAMSMASSQLLCLHGNGKFLEFYFEGGPPFPRPFRHFKTVSSANFPAGTLMQMNHRINRSVSTTQTHLLLGFIGQQETTFHSPDPTEVLKANFGCLGGWTLQGSASQTFLNLWRNVTGVRWTKMGGVNTGGPHHPLDPLEYIHNQNVCSTQSRDVRSNSLIKSGADCLVELFWKNTVHFIARLRRR